MEERLMIGESDALIVVDVQNDFCPGGALPVKDGDLVVPVLNRLIPLFRTVVFTRDWHPLNHLSFSDAPTYQDKSWPRHCVQNSAGAAFHPGLQVPPDALVVSKGSDPEQEAYSGFQGTNLSRSLRERGVARVFVGGLATDYCVKATVLDALREGFQAVVIRDAVRGVDLPPGSADQALAEMEKEGAIILAADRLAGAEKPHDKKR